MAQCRGKTKAGERCKRDASDSSDYCAAHIEQAGSAARSSSTGTDGGTDLLLVGAVALALFAVKRILRFL
jgi:hypothetical protein